MVTQLFMAAELGPQFFGNRGDSGLDAHAYAAWEPQEYSDETARRIDDAVRRLIDEAHQRARTLLSAHRAALDAIAVALRREESLDLEQIVALVGAAEDGSPGHPLSLGELSESQAS